MKVTLSDDLATCHALRREVFMEEQGVSEAEEMDGRDSAAVHFLIHAPDAAQTPGHPIGTARAFVQGGHVKIGRVCIRRSARGTGAGQVLMRAVLEWARAQGLTRAMLDAQVDVIGFYEGLGFVASGPEFDDAGIPHRHMERAL